MTAREELASKIVEIFSLSNFDAQLKIVLQSYRVQMKRNYSKSATKTAREELFSLIVGKRNTTRSFDVLEAIHPFRVQSSKPVSRSQPARKTTARKKCDVVSIADYRDSLTPTNYGYVGGGPPRKSGSRKVCPKCKSMGLYLATGYKERYYGCVYCGFHQELEAETYQY
jgi:hypothetical protein